jgi:hypothetical protein
MGFWEDGSDSRAIFLISLNPYIKKNEQLDSKTKSPQAFRTS